MIPWAQMTEEQKYNMWSNYITEGGMPLSYPAYCDFMDSVDNGCRPGGM